MLKLAQVRNPTRRQTLRARCLPAARRAPVKHLRRGQKGGTR